MPGMSVPAPDFDGVIREHLPAVYGYLLRFTGSKETAEDVAQETFIRAWRHWKKYDSTKPLKPWLLAIARNAALDAVRKKNIIPFSFLATEAYEGIFDVPDDSASPADVAAAGERRQEVHRQLAAIKPAYREVLTLHYIDEMSVPEVANILKLPLETVRTRLRRARQALRGQLKDATEPSLYASFVEDTDETNGRTPTPALAADAPSS
jgi:RNA polymerase sigma-70 factor (ECF subfamily)